MLVIVSPEVRNYWRISDFGVGPLADPLEQVSQDQDDGHPGRHGRRQAAGPEGDEDDGEGCERLGGTTRKDGRGDERDQYRARYLLQPRPGPLGEVEPAREPESACARVA